MTYVYAVAERFPAAVEGMRGVGELPVRPLAAAGLAVAVGEAPAPGAPADADLWAHELVVEALAADGRWGTDRSIPWQTTGSYLVETCAVREFATAVASLARRLDGTALTCTGPWPPYSFAAVDR